MRISKFIPPHSMTFTTHSKVIKVMFTFRGMDVLGRFSTISTKGITFVTFCLFFYTTSRPIWHCFLTLSEKLLHKSKFYSFKVDSFQQGVHLFFDSCLPCKYIHCLKQLNENLAFDYNLCRSRKFNTVTKNANLQISASR